MGLEDGLLDEGGFEFSDQNIRKSFIRKVYSILCAQLVVTIGIMSIFTFSSGVKEYALTNVWPFWLCFAVTLVVIIVLSCCPDVRRASPINIILLGIFTVCEGVLLGMACATYKTDTVLIAVGITAIIVLALTAFAFQTKIDFTMLTGVLFVALICLILFGFFAIIFQNRVLDIVYASLGALIFGIYIVVDTQLMMGGNHKYSLSPEEYIFAALNLYLDIINLFLYILMLVDSARS
ncbi:protein lifeguard 1-like [Anneissia japonica]|uniref:protein lifeguard 1-like n=1 Tax=Anneissia japonica TaxID=1529436 RepID=UPI0014256DB2|nr:protein lifeguard 1-like [Anneissia japonica]XP_033110723.1 protein lifeguard 1-like [Anneissia japonica]